MNRKTKNLRLIQIAGLLFLALQYPALALFSTEDLFLGIPVLFIYLIVVWVLAIGALFIYTPSQTNPEEEVNE